MIFEAEATTANNADEKKPPVLKPVINLSTNKIIKMVMTNETRPKVSQFSGKVNMRSAKPMVASAKLIKTATKTAYQKPVTETPGTM